MTKDPHLTEGRRPGEASIQGHVSQRIRQVFKVHISREVRFPKLRLVAQEFILEDQFSNEYMLWRALLFDGEVYEVAEWVRPSLKRRFRRDGKWCDALVDLLREKAFLAFGRTNEGIIKARSLSGNPIALEARDITAQSNLLARALETAGKAPKAPQDAKALLALDPAAKPGEMAPVLAFPTQPKGPPMKQEPADSGEAAGRRDAFNGPGTRQGGPSPMPAEIRKGAFTPDESVREYTGNPQDSGGPVRPQNAGNRLPRPNVRNQGPAQ